MFLSTPLVEAHASFGGYGELWFAFGLFLSIIFFNDFQEIRDIKLLVLAIIFALIPTFLKGYGIAIQQQYWLRFQFLPLKSGTTDNFCLLLSAFIMPFSLHVFNFDSDLLE